MDSGGKRKARSNPREGASLLSKLTFFFTYTTFRRGLKQDLEEDDIYEIVKSCSSTALGNRLEKGWGREKTKRSPQFLVPLLKIFGLEYASHGLALFIVDTLLMIAKPMLIGKIVSYFTPNQTLLTRGDALWYSAALLGCMFLNTMFIHSYMFGLEQLSLKVKGAICALIYRKALKLNSVLISQVASGQAVTLMTKDVATFDFALLFVNQMFVGIIQLVIMTCIIYRQIGASALAGVALLLVFIPFQVCLGRTASKYKLKTAAKTDQRVQVTQEALNAIKIIKMYTWEPFFSKCISLFRSKELRNLRHLFYIKATGMSIGQLSSKLALYACVMTYVSLGYHITAEKAFVVTGSFEALRSLIMYFIPIGITQVAELQASIQRITKFLQLEEVPQNYNFGHKTEPLAKVLVKDVTVSYGKSKEILADINLDLKPGLTLVTGSVGAGKSTLLKLVLEDLKRSKGLVEVCGKVSYASQEPWLFPGTIMQNIVFAEWFDQRRYDTVIEACALRKDLNALPEGDRTCVTDKGLNLSRGQKTRINLARAIYKVADIYLLDDCLSAVDAHVAKKIFRACIKAFLKDTVCILVTHQGQLLPEADHIVLMSCGKIRFQGNYLYLKRYDKDNNVLAALEKNTSYEEADPVKPLELPIEKVINDDASATESSKFLLCAKKAYKNVYEESKEEGSVKKEIYVQYFMAGGGLSMILLVVALAVIAQVAITWSEYFVSFWVDMEQKLSEHRYNQTTNTSEYKQLEESHADMLRQYSLAIMAASVFTLFKGFSFFKYCSNIASNIHKAMLNRILNATMAFFDANLSGNILNRFSRDLGLIDELMPLVIFECSLAFLILVSVLIVVSTVNPLFLIPSAGFGVVLVIARFLYIPTGRSIRRLQGSTRSAVVGHLNATLEGLTTIRASHAESVLTREFDRHQDLYNSATYMYFSMTRAFGFYLDAISGFYMMMVIFIFLFVETETLAGRVGLAITQSMALAGLLQWGVRQWAELENQMTVAERAIEYTRVDTEEKSGNRINTWPAYGGIVYNDVNLRYSVSAERVLKHVSFVVHPQQKVGIVGRTGAGKSSVISTLYRLYEYRGTITIDGVDSKGLALEFLRSKISVIPQDPVMFSGTIRANLDPNNEYCDKDLWYALDEVEMKKCISSLDADVFEAGVNFSIGQRQLLCLARAILRNNRILVLDEATANVDPETDSLIQRTIRKKFDGCTVITIAHRLHTVMDCDKILVMELGYVVEYDHPKVLLGNKNGLFYKMVKAAGLLPFYA